MADETPDARRTVGHSRDNVGIRPARPEATEDEHPPAPPRAEPSPDGDPRSLAEPAERHERGR